jgi:hypothetical protein
MSNTELMNLSVEQLRDLNKRIIEVVKIKQQSVAFVNKEQLSKGMVAEYVGLQIFITKNLRLSKSIELKPNVNV